MRPKSKTKGKITSFISIVLCVCVIFSSGTSASAETTIDNSSSETYTENAEDLSPSLLSTMLFAVESAIGFVASLFSSGESELNSSTQKSIIKTPLIITFLRKTPEFFSDVEAVLFSGTEVKIKKIGDTFCKVSYGEKEGYVLSWWLSGGKETELTLEPKFDHVYVGGTNKNRIKAIYNGTGTITWSTDNTNILSVNSSTGLVTGKSPGLANVIATDGKLTEKIPVYCIYKWKKSWTGAANTATKIKTLPSSSSADRYDLPSGTKFVVEGDDGGSAGWAYGYIEGTQKYGFVRIECLSSKGTVSQYRCMGWTYPIKETKFKNISSVYGWRNGSRHLGLDINKGSYSTILGEAVVAPFAGKVIFVNKEYDYAEKEPNYGYCIIIQTDSVDPISGNKLRAVYMHLNEAPSLSIGATVSAGKEIGKIGTTGNSSGPHLHLEINNKGTNFAGMNNSDSFDKTINPIFFYMNSGMKDSSDTTYNEYWYNENK